MKIVLSVGEVNSRTALSFGVIETVPCAISTSLLVPVAVYLQVSVSIVPSQDGCPAGFFLRCLPLESSHSLMSLVDRVNRD
jgi:hypothetical protein